MRGLRRKRSAAAIRKKPAARRSPPGSRGPVPQRTRAQLARPDRPRVRSPARPLESRAMP
ncbi:MAG: hypothetical protein C0484_04270 [Rhodospirillum sp.]|nr:hypothetical protein [Rhodospirillum sp.]